MCSQGILPEEKAHQPNWVASGWKSHALPELALFFPYGGFERSASNCRSSIKKPQSTSPGKCNREHILNNQESLRSVRFKQLCHLSDPSRRGPWGTAARSPERAQQSHRPSRPPRPGRRAASCSRHQGSGRTPKPHEEISGWGCLAAKGLEACRARP